MASRFSGAMQKASKVRRDKAEAKAVKHVKENSKKIALKCIATAKNTNNAGLSNNAIDFLKVISKDVDNINERQIKKLFEMNKHISGMKTPL